MEQQSPTVTTGGRYHLLFTLTYGRQGVTDMATMVVDELDGYKSVDGGEWQFPVDSRYYNQSIEEADKFIESKVQRFHIRSAWIYGDNRHFRLLPSLCGIETVYNLRKAGKYRQTTPAFTDLTQSYHREEKETPENEQERKRTKLIIDVATYLIAGYDDRSEELYTDESDFIDPRPCLKHRVYHKKPRRLCASTLVLMNRLTIIFLSKLITQEEIEDIHQSFFSRPLSRPSHCYSLPLQSIKEIMTLLGFDAHKYRTPLELV